MFGRTSPSVLASVTWSEPTDPKVVALIVGFMTHWPEPPAALPKLCDTSKSTTTTVCSPSIATPPDGSVTLRPLCAKLGICNAPATWAPLGRPAYVGEDAKMLADPSAFST